MFLYLDAKWLGQSVISDCVLCTQLFIFVLLPFLPCDSAQSACIMMWSNDFGFSFTSPCYCEKCVWAYECVSLGKGTIKQMWAWKKKSKAQEPFWARNHRNRQTDTHIHTCRTEWEVMEWGENAAVWHENQHSVTWPLYTHMRAHTHRSIDTCLDPKQIIWTNTQMSAP